LTAGIHYQAQALHNPTSFSATGLPDGLTIDPTTGAITGHSTSVGDHNITLTASNLSGTSPDKNVVLTVAPAPPLVETSPFLPSNMNLWLDAADSATITHSSNAVSNWTDKSGQGNHATATSGQEPTTGTRTINNANTLDFDGSEALLSSNFVLNNTHSIFAVVSSDLNGYGRILNSEGYYYLGNGNGNNNLASFYGSGNWYDANTNTPASSLASPTVIGLLSDGTNATPYYNGTALDSKSSNMGSSVPAGMYIGKQLNNGQFWDGFIAEIIIFNQNQTNPDRPMIEGYLAHKWGLTGCLASGHP